MRLLAAVQYKLVLIVDCGIKNASFKSRTLTKLFWISLVGLTFEAKLDYASLI